MVFISIINLHLPHAMFSEVIQNGMENSHGHFVEGTRVKLTFGMLTKTLVPAALFMGDIPERS